MSGVDRPVIVLGCPRSGTTLLQVAVHAHPRMALPPETWLLVDAYRRRLDFGDLTERAGRERVAEWVLARRKTRDLGLDAVQLRQRIVSAPPTLGSCLGTVLQAYAERFGKTRWGDKRPGYYQDVRVLLRLFPDAQFVHVVRDGRDCVASLKRMPWWRTGSSNAVATWVEALELGRHWSRKLGPDTWHTVQYEHLLADPEAELRRLCGFLGETYDPAMLRTGEVAQVAVPRRKTWHSHTAQPMDSTRIAAYRTGLDHDELALIETVAGRWLEHYGYPLSGAGQPSRLLLQDYRLTSIKRRAARRKRALEDVVRDARSRAPVAALPRSEQLENRERADR
jgi:LPS sulfotransferase NodH